MTDIFIDFLIWRIKSNFYYQLIQYSLSFDISIDLPINFDVGILDLKFN